METTLYYTFSTISQTLAGAVALLAGFVLYRFQALNAEMDTSAKLVFTSAIGHVRDQMNRAMLGGDLVKVLELASTAHREDFVGIGEGEIGGIQERLRFVLARRQEIYDRMIQSLFVTMALVGFSVLVLSTTPNLDRWGWGGWTLVVGVLWCWACLGSYVRVLKCALP